MYAYKCEYKYKPVFVLVALISHIHDEASMFQLINKKLVLRLCNSDLLTFQLFGSYIKSCPIGHIWLQLWSYFLGGCFCTYFY